MRSRSLFAAITTLLILHAAPALRGHGAYHDAVALLDAEVERRPNDVALLLKRARLHLSHEEWQPALQDLERIDRLSSDPVLTEGLRGAALNLGGHWSAALLSLDAHLAQHPADAMALLERGRACYKLGDLAAAVAAYREAMRTHSEKAPALYCETAGVIAAHEGPAAALVFLDQAETFASDPELLQSLLRLAVSAGEIDRALAAAATLQTLAPRPEPWMAEAARMLTIAGRAQEARAAWEKLHAHLNHLPSLERGTPLLAALVRETRQALGLQNAAPVIAAPATHSSQ